MISVVICSIDAAKYKAVCEQYKRALQSEPHEIVGIHDAKSLCEGYNRGLARATGEHVIFSHDDIEILSPDFLQRLKGHFAQYDVVGVAGTDRLVGPAWLRAGLPHIFGQVVHPNPNKTIAGNWVVSIFNAPRRVVGGMQAMDGLFLAFRRGVIERLRWDDGTFTGFHCYDVDCTFRAHLDGYKQAVACDLGILHFSAGNFKADWQRYADAFTKKFSGKLAQDLQRPGRMAVTYVKTKADALEVMTPSYWLE